MLFVCSFKIHYINFTEVREIENLRGILIKMCILSNTIPFYLERSVWLFF